MTSHVNPQQLTMFMTPREIKDHYSTHIGDRKIGYQEDSGYRSDEETWRVKGREAKERGLTESIAAEGVQYPVGLGRLTDVTAVSMTRFGHSVRKAKLTGRPMLTGGQHRVQAAYETDPDQLIPVLHHADIAEAQGDRVPESHKLAVTVQSQGGTKYRMPKMVGMTGYERQAVAQPWGPYR